MVKQSVSGDYKLIFCNNGNIELCTSCFIGKNGLGKLKEGDNKTPVGTYNLQFAFGVNSISNSKLPYIKLDKNMYWVTDSKSKFYNEFIKIVNNKKDENNLYRSIFINEVDWKEAEHLIDYPIEYEYVIALDYNKEKIFNKGSAIFLHCKNKNYTSGCIAISKEELKYLISNLEKRNKNIYLLKLH